MVILDVVSDVEKTLEQGTGILDKAISFVFDNGPRLLGAVIVLIVGLLLCKAAGKLMKKALKKSRIDETAHKLILQIADIMLKVLVLLCAAGTLGINTTSLITLLGAVGLAASLAVKDSLSSLAGGFMVLFSKPFSKGDFIETNSVSGTVENITLTYTTLKTPDNKRIYIPNGEISTSKIVNYSAEETRRLDLIYSISYQDDILEAKKILAQIVERSGLALDEPAPAFLVAEHAASSINLAVRVWVKTADYWDLNFYMNEQVKLEFDKAGISIPFNQLDVNLHGDKAVVSDRTEG